MIEVIERYNLHNEVCAALIRLTLHIRDTKQKHLITMEDTDGKPMHTFVRAKPFLVMMIRHLGVKGLAQSNRVLEGY